MKALLINAQVFENGGGETMCVSTDQCTSFLYRY